VHVLRADRTKHGARCRKTLTPPNLLRLLTFASRIPRLNSKQIAGALIHVSDTHIILAPQCCTDRALVERLRWRRRWFAGAVHCSRSAAARDVAFSVPLAVAFPVAVAVAFSLAVAVAVSIPLAFALSVAFSVAGARRAHVVGG
jgi:hypothetical protein